MVKILISIDERNPEGKVVAEKFKALPYPQQIDMVMQMCKMHFNIKNNKALYIQPNYKPKW